MNSALGFAAGGTAGAGSAAAYLDAGARRTNARFVAVKGADTSVNSSARSSHRTTAPTSESHARPSGLSGATSSWHGRSPSSRTSSARTASSAFRADATPCGRCRDVLPPPLLSLSRRT